MISVDSNKPAQTGNKFVFRIGLLYCVGAICFLCFPISCFQGSKNQKPPQPKAARRPVNQGVLIQTKAAIDYLEMVEPTLSEPESIYPALTRALATFYGWDDPEEEPGEMFFFLKQLCRARLGKTDVRCKYVRDSADGLRKALYEDAIQVCEEMNRRNIAWKGEHSPQQFAEMLRRSVDRLPARLSRLNKRWPRGVLPQVEKCELLNEKVVVVEIQEKGIWVNGLLVTKMEKGVFPQRAAETFQTLLVTGMNALPKEASVLIRAAQSIPGNTFQKVLALSAGVNFRNVAIAVYKKGDYQYPCALQFQLRGEMLHPPAKTGYLEGGELVYYEGGERKVLGVCNSAGGEGIKRDHFDGIQGIGMKSTSLSCFVEAIMQKSVDGEKRKRVDVWLRRPEKVDEDNAIKGTNLSGISGRGRFGMIDPHHGP